MLWRVYAAAGTFSGADCAEDDVVAETGGKSEEECCGSLAPACENGAGAEGAIEGEEVALFARIFRS